VPADEVDLAVDVGSRVAAARRGAGALLGRVEVVEVVVGFGQEVEFLFLLDRQRPGVVGELLVLGREGEDVRRQVAVEHVEETAVHFYRFFCRSER